MHVHQHLIHSINSPTAVNFYHDYNLQTKIVKQQLMNNISDAGKKKNTDKVKIQRYRSNQHFASIASSLFHPASLGWFGP